ncbi:MAG TPA: NADH-quinone oxidoreductase subunit NuoH, partial [Planctomycetaceae bacterium]|nr:NADH-quinone oxidoreductase subunit NuoH [Planctomycetaceae bacterium]
MMDTLLAANSLADFLEGKHLPICGCPIDSTTAMILAAIVHVTLVGAWFGLPAGIFIWAERKVSARIQDRLGPTRCGGRFGWLQSLADGIKLIQKEDLVPKEADGLMFRLAPYIVVIASFTAYMMLPFSDGWTALGLDVGLFLTLAILSLEVLGVILAGYSSGSKWALFGAMRESAQMVSYEIPMAICALCPIVTAGTLNLNEVALLQTGGVSNWNILHPFNFFAFFVFFTCATASCKRAPFDLAEAESELVAGFLTEYSGMRWSFFFLAEYASMFLVSGLATVMFLGGWDDGFGILTAIKTAAPDGLGNYLANVAGCVVFLVKASVLVCVQIWVRWTLPRLRIDQVMTTCLKYLIPISCILFAGTVAYPLVLAKMSRQTSIIGPPAGERLVKPRVPGVTVTRSVSEGERFTALNGGIKSNKHSPSLTLRVTAGRT